LEPLSVLANRKKAAVRLKRNSRLFKAIIKAIQEKKGEHILSLDLRKIPEAVTDFFILCEATSSIQVRAIADHIQEEVKRTENENPYKHEGYLAQQWILIDYVNIVVHVFQPAIRKFYRLEDMWSDADQMTHDD
jgi:ribosome-associated protein